MILLVLFRLLRVLNSGVIGIVNLIFVFFSSRWIVSMLDGVFVIEIM